MAAGAHGGGHGSRAVWTAVFAVALWLTTAAAPAYALTPGRQLDLLRTRLLDESSCNAAGGVPQLSTPGTATLTVQPEGTGQSVTVVLAPTSAGSGHPIGATRRWPTSYRNLR